MSFLEIKNADFGYKNPLVVGMDASFDLGEITLMIGNNGTGKTTFIKTLLGQTKLLRGEIFIQNKNLKSLTNQLIAQQIAVVFSKSTLPENYTTTDLISLGKFIHYPYYFALSKEDKKEIQQIIEELNLEHFAHFPIAELSDGNLQKAFIGRALAQNSPFLVLDEPTTHLDEKNKINILKILRNVAKEKNKLVLFSSHDWRLAKEFSDKIAYLKNKEMQVGLAEDVIQDNQELISYQLFDLNKNFQPPKIEATSTERELLYSLLQKNCDKNMTNITFTLENSGWEINNGKKLYSASSFSEILKLLPILHQ